MTSGRRSLDGLDRDIRDHLERETQDNIDRGMTEDEARHAALRAFGNVTLAMEDTRAVWIPVWIDQLLQDARYGLRMLRRAPAFSAVVTLTLAVGIGLTIAVFSVICAVLVRPLSYPNADRLLWIATYDDHSPAALAREIVVSPDLMAWRDHATAFECLAGVFIDGERIETPDEAVEARAAAVTDGFWDVTGAPFALGGPPVAGMEGVVLTYPFFERWFRGDRAIVGRPTMIEGRPSVVTGILRPGFHVQLPPPSEFSDIGPGDIDFYRAAVLRPPSAGGVELFSVVGRLKPGVTIERARSELEAIREGVARAAGRPFGPPRLAVLPYAETLVGSARRPLLILFAAVVLVLAIACANIANLLLARASARQREIAIRVAVGAGRGRVLRQFLVESLILAAAGGALGLVTARSAIALMLRLIPQAVPRLAETSIDGRVFAFAAGVVLTSALVFGFAPAIALRKAGVHDLLKDGTRAGGAAPSGLRVRKALVAIELALSVVLLVGAGLMAKSFARATAYPPGFSPDHVLTMRVKFSGLKYRDQAVRLSHIVDLLRRARQAPGVEEAGVSTNGDSHMLLRIEGAPDVPPDQRPQAVLSAASGGYAGAIGLQIVKGRWLTDTEPSPAFVVNETLVRRYFGGDDPIGKRIRLPWMNATGDGTVVGMVADLRYANLDIHPEPEIFVDYGHSPLVSVTLAVRTAGDPAAAAPALRALLTEADRTQPPYDVQSLANTLADSVAPRRFNMLLLGTFAGSALLLAIVGIYGVIAYAVAQRTHEIGVRMALGAQRRDVVRLIVGQGMAIVAAGIAIGIAAALALTRVLIGLLYDVAPTDPATFVAVTGLLAATAFAACGAPALKAALVDPIVALRCE